MTIRRIFKHAVASVLAADAVSPLFRPLTRGVASILMLHRFADPERGNAGHDAQVLRSHLAYLRRMRYDLVSLEELINRLRSGEGRLFKTVAFTIDDGYADYASVGAPVFEEFDCPATVFIVTGVTDERSWYWWDRLSAAFETTSRTSLTMEIGGKTVRHEWTDAASARRVARRIVDDMKLVGDAERRRVVDAIPALLETEIAPTPPARYASMTWDEIRACGGRLTTFGAHTVSHPILSRTDDALARHEIEHSWRQLREHTDAAIGVFCYPNGGPNDVTPRETGILRSLGLDAAVTSRPGYASVDGWMDGPDAPFLVPRFPYGGGTNELVQVVSGVERVKLAIRRSASR
jgi:peptidoglycan/xylan/chitin deacetylase (PgdA/CDA1 family)